MAAMWLLCGAGIGFLAGLSVGRLRRTLVNRAFDREFAALVHADRIAELQSRLRNAPASVRTTKQPLSFAGLRNRVRLDLGDNVVDARCYWPPKKPATSVLSLTTSDDGDWIIDIDGPAGPARLCAFRIRVRPGSAATEPVAH